MISIIVSSKNLSFFNDFSKSVQETIGVAYELIKVDNPGLMSIAEAYNIGRKSAHFEILCFCHEDILFRTKEWGHSLVEIFRDSTIGLVGIVGTKASPLLPIPWWDLDAAKNYSEIYQHFSGAQVKKIIWGWTEKDSMQEVIILDGVFLSTTKDKNLFFDERFKGFHFYDVGLSMNSLEKGFKNIATNKIIIEHKSNGKLDANWYRSMYLFHKLYKKNITQFKDCPTNVYAFESYKNVIIKSREAGEKKISFLFWLRLFPHKNFVKFNLKYLLFLFKVH